MKLNEGEIPSEKLGVAIGVNKLLLGVNDGEASGVTLIDASTEKVGLAVHGEIFGETYKDVDGSTDTSTVPDGKGVNEITSETVTDGEISGVIVGDMSVEKLGSADGDDGLKET